MTETEFGNKRYVKHNEYKLRSTKFYANETNDCIEMVYYNPVSACGGQLVHSYLHLDVLNTAYELCETDHDFWERIDEYSVQYLVDIDTLEFADDVRWFVEDPYDFAGRTPETMEAIRKWIDNSTVEIGSAQSILTQI
jgi:hypothetical protein